MTYGLQTRNKPKRVDATYPSGGRRSGKMRGKIAATAAIRLRPRGVPNRALAAAYALG